MKSKLYFRQGFAVYLTTSLRHQCESSPLPQQAVSSFPAPVVTAMPVFQNPAVMPVFQPLPTAPAVVAAPVNRANTEQHQAIKTLDRYP